MPAKFRKKDYIPGGVYHIYNRGLDGREVFRDSEDFVFFEKVMERYLSFDLGNEERTGFKLDKPSLVKRRRQMSLYRRISMIAYCLMPNHVHFVLKQIEERGITDFVRRVMTTYVMYFNNKYKRSGVLFESVYKAVIVADIGILPALTKMIHLNPVNRTVVKIGPVETVTGSSPEAYLYSSYSHYIGTNQRKWISKYDDNLNQSEYKRYVENWKIEPGDALAKIMLD